jgi:succinate dehydrogenase / fumarate reductase cytochrome b subunit
MSKSAILKSSIAKKWWMALTGLFLCLFLVGHLLGNLQLIAITGDEGKLAFNEYAYFMTHNPVIKIMSYVTYLSILFHAIDGILLTIQNKKARPINYAYNKPSANSSTPSRYMAILGSAILIFIIMHMANFWAVMHFDKDMPLHKIKIENKAMGMEEQYYVMHTQGSSVPLQPFLVDDVLEGQEGSDAKIQIKNGTEFYSIDDKIVVGEGYKDLHSVTLAFFGHDKTEEAGLAANDKALIAVILYVLAMAVLAFHLWHGFASAFQTLGINHKRFNPLISGFGKAFAVLVPAAFAIIPIILFLNK